MRNHIIVRFFIIISLLILVSACSHQPDSGKVQPEIPVLEPEEKVTVDLGQSCESIGGNWLDEYKECETGEKEWCSSNGGAWSDCESACRHDPTAEVCNQMCVFVCKFE